MNIDNLKEKVNNLKTDYKILYKQSDFLNDIYVFDKETKKMFNIHHLNQNKYSKNDIIKLYIDYVYFHKLNDGKIINLNNLLRENLKTDKKVVLLKDFLTLVKLKFNK